VTEPDIRSSAEASSYLTRLRQILMYTGVCDGNMEEGSLRCDANVSVRRPNAPLGTRTEVKNLNSFRFLGRAIDYEISRQIAVLESGGTIRQETRLFDVSSGETRVMRSKEEAHDYRYFPEPDLFSLDLDEEWISQVRSALPELPDSRISRYQRDYGIPESDGEILVASRAVADYFEGTIRAGASPRAAANWVRNEVLRALNERKIELNQYRVTPPMLAALLTMIDSKVIGGKAAKDVLEEMASSGEQAEAVMERMGLAQVSDATAIREAAERVVARHPTQVEQYRAGNGKLFGFLVGQVMKETGGKANAAVANQILRELVGGG
jgi:aspartyl-tRNA(Asn)/glutamyl-tRNA(Gln) amidotransferase subunit B